MKQLKDELHLVKEEIESLKRLTKEMNLIRLDYKRILKHSKVNWISSAQRLQACSWK